MIEVRVDDLIAAPSPSSDGTVVESADGPTELSRLWCMVLLIAIRDHATSIHYHPWREDGGLAYVVGGVRCALESPPANLAGSFLAVARSLFSEPITNGLPDRLRWSSGADAACASFKLDVRGDVFLWDAVVWSSGERSGVELFRVSPFVAQAGDGDGRV